MRKSVSEEVDSIPENDTWAEVIICIYTPAYTHPHTHTYTCIYTFFKRLWCSWDWRQPTDKLIAGHAWRLGFYPQYQTKKTLVSEESKLWSTPFCGAVPEINKSFVSVLCVLQWLGLCAKMLWVGSEPPVLSTSSHSTLSPLAISKSSWENDEEIEEWCKHTANWTWP